MGGHDHILPKYDLFFMFVVGEIRKIRLCQTVIFAKRSRKCRIHQQGTREAHSSFPDS